VDWTYLVDRVLREIWEKDVGVGRVKSEQRRCEWRRARGMVVYAG